MGKERGKSDSDDVQDMTPEEISDMLSEAFSEAMVRVSERLAEMLEQVDTLNSSFGATKEFLEARGLTRVNELDEEGKLELRRHLEQKLKEILAENQLGKPPKGPDN